MGVPREEVLPEEQKMSSNSRPAVGVPGKVEFSPWVWVSDLGSGSGSWRAAQGGLGRGPWVEVIYLSQA